LLKKARPATSGAFFKSPEAEQAPPGDHFRSEDRAKMPAPPAPEIRICLPKGFSATDTKYLAPPDFSF
jgi:hypothetical protein